MSARASFSVALLAIGLAASSGSAAAQGMDARQMSGIPIPSPDVAPGTVSVRLVRETMADNISGHEVQLVAGPRTLSARTDTGGRALFEGIEPGTQIRAVAVVGEERLESNTFGMPTDAGVRLVLVAGVRGATPGGMPPTGGMPPMGGMTPTGGAAAARADGLSFGSGSRIHVEFEDDVLEVFYLLELVNPGAAPVSPSPELAFELPAGAEQASPIEDSQQVTIRGRTVTIANPVRPGVTPVKLAFSLAPSGPARRITQRLPIAWDGLQVVMARAAGSQMSSPQFTSTRDGESQGSSFIVGSGGALAAGQELVLLLNGLPHRSHAGRNAALAIGLLVLAVGAYGAFSTGPASGQAGRRERLIERRDRLMADLVRIEEQWRAGSIPEPRYAARHEELVSQLERVYGELDGQEPGTAPAAG